MPEILTAITRPPKLTTLRVNTLICTREEAVRKLQAHFEVRVTSVSIDVMMHGQTLAVPGSPVCQSLLIFLVRKCCVLSKVAAHICIPHYNRYAFSMYFLTMKLCFHWCSHTVKLYSPDTLRTLQIAVLLGTSYKKTILAGRRFCFSIISRTGSRLYTSTRDICHPVMVQTPVYQYN